MNNKLILVVGTTILTIVLVGCGSKKEQGSATTEKQAQQTVQAEQADKIVISLPTMKCEMCAKTITEAVQQLDGVKAVTVRLDKKNAEVQFVAGKLGVKMIEIAISNAGYDANNTKRNEEAYKKLPECCQ